MKPNLLPREIPWKERKPSKNVGSEYEHFIPRKLPWNQITSMNASMEVTSEKAFMEASVRVASVEASAEVSSVKDFMEACGSCFRGSFR